MAEPLTVQEHKALDKLRIQKQSYLQFKSVAGIPFLRDLANFCRANETCLVKDKTGKVDPLLTAVLEGRREVWLKIQQHFNLTPTQLLQLYSGRDFLTQEEEDA